MKKLKFLIPIILILIIIFLTAYLPLKRAEEAKKRQVSLVKKTEGIALILDFGEGKISTYPGIKVAEKTVFNLLKKVTEDKNLELKIKEYSFGKLVEQIGEFRNTQEKAWIYFVNGKSGEVAADKMKIKDGDVIEWRYIAPQY